MSNTERKAVFEKTSPSSCFLLQKVPAPPFATFFIDIRSALSSVVLERVPRSGVPELVPNFVERAWN